jgi:hypothetical protein
MTKSIKDAALIYGNCNQVQCYYYFKIHRKQCKYINKIYKRVKVKVKLSRFRPGMAQRVGRGMALLFHDRGTRRGWVVRSTPRPHFAPGKYPVPILQEAGWAQGMVWMNGKSRPHPDSIPPRPARSQSLYQLSYPAHVYKRVRICNWNKGDQIRYEMLRQQQFISELSEFLLS